MNPSPPPARRRTAAPPAARGRLSRWQLAFVFAPLVLLAGIGIRGLQISRETAREIAATEATRSLELIHAPWSEGLAALRAETTSPLRYPALPAPVAAGETQVAFETAAALPPEQAEGALAHLAATQPDALSPSGVPLLPLIEWTRLRFASDPTALPARVDAFARAAVSTHPSILTQELLSQAAELLASRGTEAAEKLAPWLEKWTEDEALRACLAQNEKRLAETAPPFWIASEERRWWVEAREEESALRYIPASRLESLAASVAARAPLILPPFAALRIEAGQVSLLKETPPGVAFASLTLQGFHLSAMADPDSIYGRERLLSIWLTALLGTALVAEIAAIWMMRRALRREAQLSDLKSDFVSSVSHELRAPVASMRLMAENLESGAISDPERRLSYYRMMSEECSRLGDLIDNVLDFARIEQGRRLYHLAESDIAALALDAVQLMQPRAAQRRQTLVAELEQLGPPVQCDALALRQALVNLIDNAIKFSPEKSQIFIRLGQKDPKEWTLSVENPGPGIPRQEQGKIFQRFYRIGGEMRRETQGAGIGLSIVQHIVEAHGGTATVWSEPGQGARFTLTFPFLSL